MRVCPCLYGEISRSNLGRVRVNSGTNEREMDRDEYRSERTGGRKGVVGRREEKIRKSSHSSCSVPSKFPLKRHLAEASVLITSKIFRTPPVLKNSSHEVKSGNSHKSLPVEAMPDLTQSLGH